MDEGRLEESRVGASCAGLYAHACETHSVTSGPDATNPSPRTVITRRRNDMSCLTEPSQDNPESEDILFKTFEYSKEEVTSEISP